MNVFMGNSVWHLIAQSDKISKLVLLLLLFMSIACWTVFLYKLVLLRLKQRHMKRAFDTLKTMNTMEDVTMAAAHLHDTIPGYFMAKNLTFIKAMIERNKEQGNAHLTHLDWERVQAHMYQTVDDMVYNDESYVSLLSTSAAVSPLLGLFGTVWGLVHSFIRISEKQSADIVTVAPGIAEALITTLAGLMVAIPALIMYNYIQVCLRQLEQQYVSFSDKVGFALQRLLVK